MYSDAVAKADIRNLLNDHSSFSRSIAFGLHRRFFIALPPFLPFHARIGSLPSPDPLPSLLQSAKKADYRKRAETMTTVIAPSTAEKKGKSDQDVSPIWPFFFPSFSFLKKAKERQKTE